MAAADEKMQKDTKWLTAAAEKIGAVTEAGKTAVRLQACEEVCEGDGVPKNRAAGNNNKKKKKKKKKKAKKKGEKGQKEQTGREEKAKAPVGKDEL